MGLTHVTIAFLLTAAIVSAQTHEAAKKREITSKVKRSKSSHPKGATERKEEPRFDAALVNNPNQPDIKIGEKGSSVLRAQILLDRASFSCGEIDGHFGSNLAKALSAFLQSRNLPPASYIDGATWAALNSDQAPALQAYRIAPEDVKGPFVRIPKEMSEQAELPALGYASPLEALGERFHVSPSVLRALNPGTVFDRAGQPMFIPNVMTMPPGPAARIEVSKSESSVRAYDATGKLLAFYVATIGSEHDPLPIGEWVIRGVGRNPKFHYNPDLFWDAKPDDSRATIAPGPNNPVGVVWIDLNKEHYGIHGTPEPSRVGHTTSHGCIRLTNWDAAELAAMVKPGIPAILKE
jgi:lipoprotein-anchoring transpeptidase ErfK/SrfK